MTRALEPLLEEGVIGEILGRLKSGKEADIWLVTYGGRTVAAKVYKDAHQRSFKNNADYKEGRGERSSRTRRAIESGSRFGRKAQEEAWRGTEAQALHTLYAAGVRVPEPVLFFEGILLMQLVTSGEDGVAAPRLIEATYRVEEARPLYLELRRQLILILSCGLVHGDLSPYNILAAADGPTVIDFPQVVSVAHNSRAEFFFQRDFKNLLDFVVGIDPSLHAAYEGDGRAIWRAYVRQELTPDYVPPPSVPRAAQPQQQPWPQARREPRDGGRPAPHGNRDGARHAPHGRRDGAPGEHRPNRDGGGQERHGQRAPRPHVAAPPPTPARPDYEASRPADATPPRVRPAPVPKYVVPPRWVAPAPSAPQPHNRGGRVARGQVQRGAGADAHRHGARERGIGARDGTHDGDQRRERAPAPHRSARATFGRGDRDSAVSPDRRAPDPPASTRDPYPPRRGDANPPRRPRRR